MGKWESGQAYASRTLYVHTWSCHDLSDRRAIHADTISEWPVEYHSDNLIPAVFIVVVDLALSSDFNIHEAPMPSIV